MKIKKNFYTDKLAQFKSTNATAQDVVDFVSGKDYWRLPSESEITQLLQLLNPAPVDIPALTEDDTLAEAKVYVTAISASKESAYQLWKMCKKARIRKMVIAGGITAVIVGGIIAYFIIKDKKNDNNDNDCTENDDDCDAPVVIDDEAETDAEEFAI